MSNRTIYAQPITQSDFAPFGEVIDTHGEPDKIINRGLCGRYHDRASIDVGADARVGISLFKAQPRSLPYTLDMVERHPEGSQAFVPMSFDPFLVIVATDVGGTPDTPLAFMTTPGQAINFHKNTWHGILTPLHTPGLFAVIDRIGKSPNLEEFFFDLPYIVAAQ